ncbi:MAG: Spy/CpxP family protein refolding chaperone [Desulfobacterales bacterium]|nr:Spy/CpxP family protein refolding chaperone [Desulfobacterales bacterium]
MNQKKTIAGAVAGLLIFMIAFAVEAGPIGFGRPGAGMDPGLGRLQLFMELKLTEAQQAEMMNIINRYRVAGEPLRSNVTDARKNLRAIIQSDLFNEAAVRQAFRQVSALREDRFVLRAKMMGELNALLTPAQREVLKDKKA